MQRCSCIVRHAGNLLHEVYKPDVTVAEIVVLRAIHGGDAVVHIQPTRQDKKSHRGEWDRLCQEYGPGIVTKLWPGVGAALPRYLKDIAIEPVEAEDDGDDDDMDDAALEAATRPDAAAEATA